MVSPYCGFPLPDALFEFLAAQVAAVDALFGELALHHHLGGDAGVVGAGQPQRVVAEHAMPADGDVDLGVLEHVADVQRAGDVGRRNDEGKDARRGFSRGGAEDAGVDPPLRPMRLEPLGLVHFLNLHGKDHDIRGTGFGLGSRDAIQRRDAENAEISAEKKSRRKDERRGPSFARMTGQEAYPTERHFGIEIGWFRVRCGGRGFADLSPCVFRPPVIWLESTKT